MLSVLQQIGKVGVVPLAKTSVVEQIKKEEPLPVPNIHSLFQTKNVQEPTEDKVTPKAVPIPKVEVVVEKASVLSQLKSSGLKIEKAVKQEPYPDQATASPDLSKLFGGQLA